MFDRRHRTRHQLAVPVLFETGNGITRDLNADGIFFETDASPEVGTTLRLALSFTSLADSQCAICCDALVVRLQPVELGYGVAARILSLEISSFPAWFTSLGDGMNVTEH